MACNGPDLDKAKEHGQRSGEMVLDDLVAKYSLFDVTDDKYNGMIQWPGSRDRWAAAKAAFIEAVGVLFVEDASNSF